MGEQVKITGIKRAVGEYSNWVGGAIVYLNKETGEVWTSVYPDGNSWDEYRNDAIVMVTRKGHTMASTYGKITMAELNKLVDEVMNGEHN